MNMNIEIQKEFFGLYKVTCGSKVGYFQQKPSEEWVKNNLDRLKDEKPEIPLEYIGEEEVLNLTVREYREKLKTSINNKPLNIREAIFLSMKEETTLSVPANSESVFIRDWQTDEEGNVDFEVEEDYICYTPLFDKGYYSGACRMAGNAPIKGLLFRSTK